MEPPRAVLFDVGDTLLSERSYRLREGMSWLLSPAGPPGGRGAGSAEALAVELSEHIDRVHTTNDAEFVLADWLREKLSRRSASDLQAVEEGLFERIADLVPMPGVDDALSELAHRGIPMAAVSNAIFSGRTLQRELDRHGLASSLAFVLSSADLGIRKPSPGIFREALRRLALRGPEGRSATGVWFVGDSFENDVAGAAGVGMSAIWLSPRGCAPRGPAPHRRVAGWSEFIALLGPRG